MFSIYPLATYWPSIPGHTHKQTSSKGVVTEAPCAHRFHSFQCPLRPINYLQIAAISFNKIRCFIYSENIKNPKLWLIKTNYTPSHNTAVSSTMSLQVFPLWSVQLFILAKCIFNCIHLSNIRTSCGSFNSCLYNSRVFLIPMGLCNTEQFKPQDVGAQRRKITSKVTACSVESQHHCESY